MDRAQQVIDRALAAVAASRARREREAKERREVFGRIQIASIRKPVLPKGIQIPLDLH